VEDAIVSADLFERQMEENRKAYEALRETILRDHAGEYVGIAFGRLIASSTDFDEVVAAVNALRPEPEHSVVFPAGEEPMFEPFYDTHVGFLEE
jgi:hypothetical protein